MKIKIKRIPNARGERVEMPKVIGKGDWIDLRAAIGGDEESMQHYTVAIPLGVAIKLPDGYEALVLSRSSTYKHFGLRAQNAVGVIDNSYCGDGDQWHYVAFREKKRTWSQGDRICQFRVQLSQKATVWQKLRWLFDSHIEIVEVDELNATNRGGIGSTGVK